MNQHKDRIRHARRWKRIRDRINLMIDDFCWWILNGYELPHNSRWILFAELFWIRRVEFCPVCFFYRGAVFGFLLASLFAFVVLVLI